MRTSTPLRLLLSSLLGLLLLAALRVAFDDGPGRAAAASADIALQQLASGLGNITSITNAGDSRLFLTYRNGQIAIWDGTKILSPFFLDVDPLVQGGGEEGLLGLAFHPQYAGNGFFFVYYTNNSGDNVVARYQVSTANRDLADASTGVILMTISHPTNSNHNGGQLQFGPDGFLYIGTGDGGSANDPPCNAQNTGTRLGKLLRIDVNVSTAPYWRSPASNPFADAGDPGLDEIWAFGLRNPWRFSFDRLTGDLWIGDVGQGAREEIDFQPKASPGGENYGWKIMEGTRCTGITTNCTAPAACGSSVYTNPVLEYDHTFGCSVTGGYVYRGASIPGLYGTYLYGDYCSGNLWGNGQLFTLKLPSLSTFGEDSAGELYAATINGALYRVVDASPTTPTSTPTAVPATLTPTRTPTAAPPTPTRTRTPTPVPPTPTRTRTPTPIPPTATRTRTPTPVPPTPTRTRTPIPIPPTATRTPTSGPPVQSFSDTFDRLDSTILGNGWVEVAGDLNIGGLKLKNASLKGAHMAVQPGLSSSAQTVSADFTSTDSNLGPRFAVILRYQDPLNHYRIARQTGGSSLLRISRVVGGVETFLKSVAIANPAKNVPFRLEGRANGTTLTVAFNGVDKASVTDTTFSSGAVGVLLHTGTGTSIHSADNFLFTSP